MLKLWLAALAIMLAAASAPALAAEDQGVITVRGSKVVEVEPDYVDIVIGVETEDATAPAAIDANSDAMTRVIADAQRANIARRDIQTSTLVLNQFRDQNQKLRYRAVNSVRVRVRELPRFGATLRQLVGSGANLIRGIRFGTSEASAHLREARKQAVLDARAKAETIAEAAGVRLGAVLEISDATSEAVASPMLARAAAPADVPVESGQVALSANVQVKWRTAP